MPEKMVEFDLHGHTRFSSIPEFVNYSPTEAVIRAKEVGLDGVAITGHDTLKGLDEALNAAAKYGICVVPGVEISSRVGLKTPHILALGVTPEIVVAQKTKLPSLKDPEAVIKWIHDQGGVAIAAHPTLEGGKTDLSFEQVRKYRSLLDGIEVATSSGYNFAVEELAKELDIAQLGSSDYHMLAQIGLVGTHIYRDSKTWQDVINAIKTKQSAAFIRSDIPLELMGRRTPHILLRQWRGEKI